MMPLRRRLFPAPDPAAIFAVEPLPGQFDQRADSAAQCVQLMTAGGTPHRPHRQGIRSLGESLTAEDAGRCEALRVNPVESREASLELPDTLRQ
ncbi:MAG: hypothetical protein V8R75_16080 [Oscillospiraceae bacterium]